MVKMLERELNPQAKYDKANWLMSEVDGAELSSWKASNPTKALLARLEGDLLGILQSLSAGNISMESVAGTAQLYSHTVGQTESIERIIEAIANMETIDEADS